MKVEELVGSFQTFEVLLPRPKNSKNLAFNIKTIKGKSVDLSDEESRDDEEIAMIARNFRKFLRNNGNFRSRESKNSMNPSHEVRDNYEDRNDENQKNKLSRGCKCHECGGIGHIRVDCGNLINLKGSAFNVTQSDESDNEEKAKNVANYVAFGISYDSEHDANESNSLDSEYGICDNES
jgi:predicted nucleic acid-binding Zn ribbon protein